MRHAFPFVIVLITLCCLSVEPILAEGLVVIRAPAPDLDANLGTSVRLSKDQWSRWYEVPNTPVAVRHRWAGGTGKDNVEIQYSFINRSSKEILIGVGVYPYKITSCGSAGKPQHSGGHIIRPGNTSWALVSFKRSQYQDFISFCVENNTFGKAKSEKKKQAKKPDFLSPQKQKENTKVASGQGKSSRQAVKKGTSSRQAAKPSWLSGNQKKQPAPAKSNNRTDSAQSNGQLKGYGKAVLIVIDVSESMAGEKLEEAKAGAVTGIQSAVSANMWFGVIAFGGDCDTGVRMVQPWTRNVSAATRTIQGLYASGSTPLSAALDMSSTELNRFVGSQGQGGVILLADGQNSCGSLSGALAAMRARGIRFHYETIGVGVSGTAAQDLAKIARSTGGNYTSVMNADQIQGAFRTSFENLRKFILDWRW